MAGMTISSHHGNGAGAEPTWERPLPPLLNKQTIKQNNRKSIAEIEGYFLSEKTDRTSRVLFSKSQI